MNSNNSTSAKAQTKGFRWIMPLALGITAVLAVGSSAFAAPGNPGSGNPRWTTGPINEGIKPDGSDTITGTIQGVGESEVIFNTQADAAALYACKNNGKNFPNDPKKQTESEDLSDETRANPRNGRASLSVALQPPASTLDCPNGQTAVLVCVEYANKRVTVSQNNQVVIPTTSTTPSSVSAIFEAQFSSECATLFASNP